MESKDIQHLIVDHTVKTPQTDFNNGDLPWDIYKRAYQDVQMRVWIDAFTTIQNGMRPYQGSE